MIPLEKVREIPAEKSRAGYAAEVRAIIAKHGADKGFAFDDDEESDENGNEIARDKDGYFPVMDESISSKAGGINPPGRRIFGKMPQKELDGRADMCYTEKNGGNMPCLKPNRETKTP